MEKRCPVCNGGMEEGRTVCRHCFTEILEREYPRREAVLYRWGRTLLFFLSLFFFGKGMLALLEPETLRRSAEQVHLSPASPTVHYFTAALFLAAGILYAVSWLGGYLGKKWHRAFCFVTLGVFVLGYILLQFPGAHTAEDVAKRIALVLLWISLPVIQAVMLGMGRPPAPGTGGERDGASPTV